MFRQLFLQSFHVNPLFIAFFLLPENTNDPSIIMMASTICALILDGTSESALVGNPNLGTNCVTSLSGLFSRSLGQVSFQHL